ncbi:HEAT repeat domain-containing protein [Aquabacterium sp. A7-Y]|uniref:HEAT repeat domain-containing protein n=1 Tax=Aquabacterium sp. A7-Y TaxID=1349605 RepID=UPI00223D9898|nr:HEAT repeat domain-containing protein [Aquabacterium sp. A7-Y]MCW7541091.1 HEAT repeat domain-containing protein [Aquabacterium sp. A7-Y]
MALTKAPSAQRALHAVEPARPADDAAALPALLARLHAADAADRRGAARDLAGRAEAAPALGARLSEEADPSVRSVLFTSLARTGGGAAVAALLPLLRSEEAALRNGAIEVLARLPDAVGPHLDALLADADDDVRIFAVNLLGELPHAGVPQWLDRVLRDEHAVNVVAAALEVLAEVGTPAALGALAAARGRFADDPFIGFAADLAQARIEAA